MFVLPPPFLCQAAGEVAEGVAPADPGVVAEGVAGLVGAGRWVGGAAVWRVGLGRWVGVRHWGVRRGGLAGLMRFGGRLLLAEISKVP